MAVCSGAKKIVVLFHLFIFHFSHTSMLSSLLEQHRTTLSEAVRANQTRNYYSHWQESPSKKFYGETAVSDGEVVFKKTLNQAWTRGSQSGSTSMLGEEKSPYGFPLGITYPFVPTSTLITQAEQAGTQWKRLTPEERAVILIESLERASASFFEIAYATMHTTGQGFAMAFQAAGPHAFDRALEALAVGYQAQTLFTDNVEWTKSVGSSELRVRKTFRIVPKGIGVVIGCSTFPTWNTLPGLFASLVTGNPVIVKPHPASVYPIALVVSAMQSCFAEYGIDPHVVQLAMDSSTQLRTLEFVEHPAISVIDFTGGAFGNTIEDIARKHGKVVFTEKAGVNGVILESVHNLDTVLDNLAFTISLYSGQMCTTSQNFFINRAGVLENGVRIPLEEVTQRFAEKIRGLALNPKMGAGVCGAIQSTITAERLQRAQALGLPIICASEPLQQAGFEQARSFSPLVLQATASQTDIYEHEWFGPISFVIPTDSFEESVTLLVRSLKAHGALTTLVYTTNTEERTRAEDAILFEGKTAVAFNYTGNIFVNQSAAFSDFHGAGANPAGNASFADVGFVVNRFNVIGTREVLA
jgi:phenylacetic acid degradation protein paaN